MDLTLPLANSEGTDILFWSAVLIVVIGLGAFGVMSLRKWIKSQNDTDLISQTGLGGFSISDLNAMAARGEMTQDELERAKEKILERARKLAADDETMKQADAIRRKKDGGTFS